MTDTSPETEQGFAELRSVNSVTDRITPAAIADFLGLQPEYSGERPAVSFSRDQLAAGASSGTLMFGAHSRARGEEALVLRFDLGGAFFTQYDLPPQFHVMRALQGTGLPVPEALWLDTAGDIAGAPALVMRRVIGNPPSMNPFNDGLLTRVSQSQRNAMLTDALTVFANLHSLDPALLPQLEARGSGGHFIDREIEWTSRELEAAFGAPDAADERADLHAEMSAVLMGTARWLTDNAPRGRAAEIAHGDASMANIMFDDDLNIAALLDWELCHHGLGEADLAYFLSASETSRRMSSNAAVPSPPSAELIDIYRKARGKLEDWGYAQVLGNWRCAAWTSIGLKRFPRELWPLQRQMWEFQRDLLEQGMAAA